MKAPTVFNLQTFAAFFLGAAVSGAAVAAMGVRREHQQSRLAWVGFLDSQMRILRQAGRAGDGALRSRIEQDLPRLCQSVASFGVDEGTAPVLAAVRTYFLDSGRAVPAELRDVLPSF